MVKTVIVALILTLLVCGCSGSNDSEPVNLQSISVTPAGQVGIAGTSQQFTATGTLSNGATRDLTGQVLWTSSNPAIATVNAAGLASAVSAGTVAVTASSGSITGSASFTVVTLVSVTLSPSDPIVDVGTGQRFTALGTLSDATTRDVTSLVNWSSANPAIVTISGEGAASALSLGSTSISAAFPGIITQSTGVTVAGPTAITVTPASASAVAGSTQQFTAIGAFADGKTADLTSLASWSSSQPGIATISNSQGSKGLAAAVGNGTTVIAATLGAQGSTSLTVRTLSSLAVTPSSPSIAVDSSLQLTATGTFSDGATQDLTNSVTWTSSAPGVASVSDIAGSKGLVSARAPGSATITGTFGALSSSSTVTVRPTDRAFVTNSGNSQLSVLDTNSNLVVSNIPVAAAPQGVAVDASNNRAYVANTNSGTLSVVDIATSSVFRTVSMGAGPWGVALDAAAGRVYVANSQSGTVSVLDTTSNTVVATIAVGVAPRGIAVNSAASEVYVANFGSNEISVIDAVSNTEIDVVSAGSGPVDVAVNVAGTRLYVVNSFSPTLSVIDTATLLPVANVNVGLNAYAVAVHPAANRVYVTLTGSNTVAVIDTGSNTVITTIPVGAGPRGVVVKGAANRVYVANNASNTISVIDTVTNSVIATIPGVLAPNEIDVIQ